MGKISCVHFTPLQGAVPKVILRVLVQMHVFEARNMYLQSRYQSKQLSLAHSNENIAVEGMILVIMQRSQ